MSNVESNEAASEEPSDFIPLFDLLKFPRMVSVASIVTVIENMGIWAWDEYGRLLPHEGKSAKIAEALALMSRVYAEDLEEQIPREHRKHRSNRLPLTWQDDPFTGPLLKFGWPREKLPNFESIKAGQIEFTSCLGQREKASYLRIIMALVEYIRSAKPKLSEGELIRQLIENYPNNEGVSKPNLEKRFAEAKRVDFKKPKAQEITPTNK